MQLVHRSMQIIDQAPTDSGFRGQWVTPGAVLEVEFDKSDNYMPSRVSGHYKKTEFNYEVAKPTPKDLGEPFCQINTKWFELDEGIMAPISILNSVARVHPKKKQAQDLELIAVWRHGAAKEEDFSLSNLNGDRSNLIKLQESIIAEMKKLHGK